jgi:hypothetical protein
MQKGFLVRSSRERAKQNSAEALPTEEDARNLNHPETPGLSLKKVVEWREWLTRIANCYTKTIYEYQHKH